jgi:hypothetical protein
MYCVARGLIETMRIDDARLILGIRLNVFTALIVGAGALLYLVRSSEKNPGREIMSRGKLVLQNLNSETNQEPITEAIFVAESQPPTPRSNQPGRRRKS